jgi:hypothetical protein
LVLPRRIEPDRDPGRARAFSQRRPIWICSHGRACLLAEQIARALALAVALPVELLNCIVGVEKDVGRADRRFNLKSMMIDESESVNEPVIANAGI